MWPAGRVCLNSNSRTSTRSMWMTTLKGTNARACTGWPSSRLTSWTSKELFQSSAGSTPSNSLKLWPGRTSSKDLDHETYEFIPLWGRARVLALFLWLTKKCSTRLFSTFHSFRTLLEILRSRWLFRNFVMVNICIGLYLFILAFIKINGMDHGGDVSTASPVNGGGGNCIVNLKPTPRLIRPFASNPKSRIASWSSEKSYILEHTSR